MPTANIKLHRVLRAPPERVYRAFLEADAMAKWLPPYGFTRRMGSRAKSTTWMPGWAARTGCR